MYLYIKALHIVFVVTWFAGLFYIVRLFIYNREANDKPETERKILQAQFQIMIRRLWWGITWPSCILTLAFGTALIFLLGNIPDWLVVKLCFVGGLLLYHLSIHGIYRQQSKNIFPHSSQQLRLWNEVATVFLFAIVFLAVLKNTTHLVTGLAALVVLVAVLMLAARVYKNFRSKS